MRARVQTIRDADAAVDAPLPHELVRFRTFASTYANGADEQDVFDLLRGRLRFKDITTFNDPFEGRPLHVAAYEDVGQQRQEMIRYLTDIAPVEGSVTAKRRWAQNRIAGKGQQEIIEIICNHVATKDQSGEVFVFCLMAPNTVSTPLPWSHYADAHHGVCIHFDSSFLPISLAFPIEYDDEYPTIAVPRTAQTDWTGVKNTLLRKSLLWRYESEYRVFRFAKEPGRARLLFNRWEGDLAIASPRVCTAITLGCRMKGDVRERIGSWIRANAPHVEMWQARLHRSRYEIGRERVV